MLSPEEFSEGGAGVSNRPQSRVYKILTRTRYTTVTKTNQVIDCDTRESHKDGHVGTTRAAGIVFRTRSHSKRSTRILRPEFVYCEFFQVQYSKLAKNFSSLGITNHTLVEVATLANQLTRSLVSSFPLYSILSSGLDYIKSNFTVDK